MTDHCPTCGASLAKPGLFQGAVQKRIYEALCRYPGGITTAHLCALVYESGPDGGPEDAENCIRVHIFNMKAVLASQGLKIVSSRGRGATYRLVGV